MKKKLLSTILALCMVMAMLPSTALATSTWNGTIPTADASDTFSGGDGSFATPYLISTAADLAQLSANVTAGTGYRGEFFEMTDNIDLNSGVTFTFVEDTGLDTVTNGTNTFYLGTGKKGDASGENTTFDTTAGTAGTIYSSNTATAEGTDTIGLHSWSPIGTDLKPFSGNFDGDNHTVSGIYLNTAGYPQAQGLFGMADSSATIKNIGVINAYIKGNQGIAGIVGFNGFSPINGGTLTNCFNTGTIVGNSHIGGITGQSIGGSISNCYNTGTAISTNWGAGGIATYIENSSIKNCYNTGSVSTAIGGTVGGIVGDSYNSELNNCYNTGEVTGTSAVGSLTGSNRGFGTVRDCYWLAGSSASGFGSNSATVRNCYSFSGSGTTWTLANGSAYRIGTATVVAGGSLLTALNTWVSDTASSTYYTWKADSGSINGGYPLMDAAFFLTYDVTAATNGVVANGVTATATFGATPYAAGATATVTITLSGTALVAGTHTIGLTSTKAGTITAPASVIKTVTAAETSTDTFVFTFTMPANAVDDFAVTNTFVPLASTTPAVTSATVSKTATTQVAVSYTLTSALTGTWEVYNAASGGSIVAGVTASAVDTTLTLTHATDIPAGTYYISVTEVGKSESARLELTVSAYGTPTYTMSASALTTFASQTVGYGTAPAAQTVTITNTTTQAITLTQPTSVSYDIGTLSITTLAISGTATFTVQPKTGLAVGTYNETINIAGSNSATTSVSAQFTVTAATTRDGGPHTPTATNGADITVNGTTQTAGTVSTTTTDGRTTTTITVDDTKLDKILESAGSNATVTIPSTSGTDVTVGVLNGQTIKEMETKTAVLVIKTGTVTYTLPASEINIDAVSGQLGDHVQLKDIKISVSISAPSADTVKIVEDMANKNSFQIVVQPVEFEITASSGSEKVSISRFNGYVERMVAIPDGIDPNNITTGVVLNADGTLSHVPTTIVLIDGKYYAKINSLTNSTYSVIYNQFAFSDLADHWAKDTMNEMGSRLIITGDQNGNSNPDNSITRAEFAAIIVRALGLSANGTASFTDVATNAWYYGAVGTAYQYGIVGGRGNHSFAPNASITREEAMTMIYRAAKLASFPALLNARDLSSEFIDYGTQSAWAAEAVAFNLNNNLIKGSDGYISPKAAITRAEVATVVLRLLQRAELVDIRTVV